MLQEALLIFVWTFAAVIVAAVVHLLFIGARVLWQSCFFRFRFCPNIPYIKQVPIYTSLMLVASMYGRESPRAMILQIFSAFCKLFEKERIGGFLFGYRPMVFFFKPEMIEVLLNNTNTMTKSIEYLYLKSWLGTGLLTSTGGKWRSRRKLITPSFHFQILENFIPVFNEEAAILVKNLNPAVGKEWIDIVHPITMCTLDTICQTAMGVHMNTQSGCCKHYVEAINDINDVIIYRMVRPWFWSDPLFLYVSPVGWRFRKNLKCLQDFTKKVIKEKKEHIINHKDEQVNEEMSKPKKKAFLELLLEHHLNDASLTEEDIREEMDTFMFEGHDTTAMSLCWTLYLLGRHPEIQMKVHQELEDIFGNETERPITADDLRHMKYLECTIKESLRLYPSVPFIARQLTEDLKVDKYVLKPGCTCVIAIHALHMDPEYYPQPEIFKPDRFLPDAEKRHPYAFVPFSAGPRNCIGQKFALMEEKIILAHVLRKYNLTSLDTRDKMNVTAGLILKNTKPIRIKFKLRATEGSI